MRSFKRYLIPVILILAIIGLSFELTSNPKEFLTRILVGIGVITIIYFIYRAIVARRLGSSPLSSRSGPTRAQLTKAKRTSTKPPTPLSNHRVNKLKHTSTSKLTKQTIKRKEAHHLTVIEGKKNKKKNRALF